MPLIVAIGQATYAFAPAAFGVLRAFDATGELFAAQGATLIVVAAIVQVSAITCFLGGRRAP